MDVDAFRLLISVISLTAFVDFVDCKSSSACFGSQSCDFFSMQCPANQIIKLNNLYAGYKNTTTYPICGNAERHCESQKTCCSYASGGNDYLEMLTLENTYHTYTNCSGRQSCIDIHAHWQLLQITTSKGAPIYSSFVQLEYDCEDASSKIPFCGGSTGTSSGIYSYAEIMFDGSLEKFDPLKASKDCLCTVTNRGTQQNVIFRTIDVRLESHQKGVNQSVANCSSAFFMSNVIAAKCQPTDKHFYDTFYYDIQETLVMPAGAVSEISLTDLHNYGALDSPSMVWISLQGDHLITLTEFVRVSSKKAEIDNGIKVTCKEMASADLTTVSLTTKTSLSQKPITNTTTIATTTTTSASATKSNTTSHKLTAETTSTKSSTTLPTPSSSLTTTKITTSTTTVFVSTKQSEFDEERTTTMQTDRVRDGEEDSDQQIAVYLAFIVPITMLIFLLTLLLLRNHWRRRKILRDILEQTGEL